VDLLIKWLKIIGLPENTIELFGALLKNRTFYVIVGGKNSVLFELLGAVQGSILGPVLYAIFVSPLFKITDVELFADDSFITRSSKSLNELIAHIKKALEANING
jgi:hypothetical protein